MTYFLEKLTADVYNSLKGRQDSDDPWYLRPGESWIDREKLLASVMEPGSRYGDALDFLRGEDVPRALANRVLACHSIPTTIPAGAMEALGLNTPGEKTEDGVWHAAVHTEDGSPFDYPVFWDEGNDGGLYWRRTDLPIYAAQDDDDIWSTGSATY
jgi:hypothetical protein